jgi:phenylalanyl-tRNA synthetase alpha chain
MGSKTELLQEQADILEALKGKEKIAQEKLVEQLQEDQVKVARRILELKEKQLVTTFQHTEKSISLTKEGKKYLKNGLPEKQAFQALQKHKGKIPLGKFFKSTKLDKKILNIAIGWLRRKGLAKFSKEGKKSYIEAIEKPKKDLDEEVLALISKGEIQNRIDEKKIQKSLEQLKKRNILTIDEKIVRYVQLTEQGEELLKKGFKIQQRQETNLTPQMIVTGSWKKKDFKKYDPNTDVPPVYAGRKHPVIEIINQIREIFIEMGFHEIRGPIVETEFWNFDALFQPQDHPARMMHDTFKIAKPKKGKLPAKKQWDNVRKTHENGWKTGSKGWDYSWKKSIAQQLVLRTHTTATTVRHLSKAFSEWTPPEKVFSVDRVYRNESVDFKHLAEFMQIDGIVVGENVTLRHLKGNLKTFYSKMGFDKIRLIPCYFPYTEPSMSTLIYVDKFDSWLEMGGSGIFRPEVTLPFGVKEKVLAWGQGLDRLVMLKLALDDIREVYTTDIERLRNTPLRI